MDGRRKQRQPKTSNGTPKIAPLASYGIKVYGREYQKWPSRYNKVFNGIIGSTCACSTAEMIHSQYRETLQALGYDTELPSTIDSENFGENIQQARDIQRRTISLYQRSFNERDSRGPTEEQWRQEIDDLVLGRFDQYSVQRREKGRMTPSLRQEFNSKENTSINNVQSPISATGKGIGVSGLGYFGATSQQETTTNPVGGFNRSFFSPGVSQQQHFAKSPPPFDVNNMQKASKSDSPTRTQPALTDSDISKGTSQDSQSQSQKEAPGLPSLTRSSSYCSSSLNELYQQRHFASVMSRPVLEDDLGVDAFQPVQKPDRIIGLAIRNSPYDYTYISRRADDIYHQRIHDLKRDRNLNLSPFSNGDFGTLILPFAVFEAKNAHGTYWPALETQTALPVAKFLRLQINLQEATGLSPSECSTLVWMFGSIGSEWHVYGCYAVWYNREKEWRFKIVQLASMDIRVEKEALRLLNIIDLVLLWAQSYRQRVIEDIQKLEVVTISDRE